MNDAITDPFAAPMSPEERESLHKFMAERPLLCARAGINIANVDTITHTEMLTRLHGAVNGVLDEAPPEHVLLWAEKMLELISANNGRNEGDKDSGEHESGSSEDDTGC